MYPNSLSLPFPLNVWIQFANWATANPTTFLLIFVGYFSAWLFMVYNCLESEEGVDRLTWLIVLLAVPLFGILFYGLNVFRRIAKEQTN